MKLKVIENQSALDIVAQNLGKLEAAFDFCLANGKNLTEDFISGEVVEIPVSLNSEPNNSEYFSRKKIQLATGFPLVEELQGGIGIMRISTTFIVN